MDRLTYYVITLTLNETPLQIVALKKHVDFQIDETRTSLKRSHSVCWPVIANITIKLGLR
jgi:hypothetical protein